MLTINELLQGLGLSGKETKVFLSLASLGSSPVSVIAHHAGITRTNMYDVIKELEKKGLVAEREERGVRRFEAIDYTGLLAYVSRKKRDLQTIETGIIKSASLFHGLHLGKQQKTKVRFYDGIEGARNILNEIPTDLEGLETPYTFRSIFSIDKMESLLPGFLEKHQHIYFEPYMTKYSIVCESILLGEFLKRIKSHRDKKFHYRVWPKQKKEFPTDTICWLNKLAFIDLVDYPSGIIIENNAMAESFVMWFDELWQSLGKV